MREVTIGSVLVCWYASVLELVFYRVVFYRDLLLRFQAIVLSRCHTGPLPHYFYFEAKYSRAKEVRESINPSMKIRELALR
jgi:hypothetical protein